MHTPISFHQIHTSRGNRVCRGIGIANRKNSLVLGLSPEQIHASPCATFDRLRISITREGRPGRGYRKAFRNSNGFSSRNISVNAICDIVRAFSVHLSLHTILFMRFTRFVFVKVPRQSDYMLVL